MPTCTYECKNLLSTTKYPDDVSRLIKAELENEFIIGPFSKPPFDVYRISPIGIVEGKYSRKKRLILDLSAPHNYPSHQSLNDLINKDEFSLTYIRIDDAIKIINNVVKVPSVAKQTYLMHLSLSLYTLVCGTCTALSGMIIIIFIKD